MIQKLGALNIQFFAEGGAVGESAGVGNSQSGDNKATVVYGKQPEDTSAAGKNKGASAENQNDGAESFEELIKGKYKDDYNKSVQGIVGKRLAQEKARTQKNDAILQKMMVRHGVENIEDLEKALDSDEAFEALAAEKGENPETIRELERLRVIERNAREARRQSEIEHKANETYGRWTQEAESVKERYPEFDLNKELESADFRGLLQRNIPMEHAYKLIHHDELVKAAETAAAEKFSKSVNARAARPSENGLGNQSGVVVKNDVSKLTKKDRAEIAKRAARGERIEF